MNKKRAERISNRLAEFRERRGLAATELAALVGVTRQTIYAIESNNYAPNTLLALRLARVLQTTVEDLFHLEADPEESQRAVNVELILGDSAIKAGQPVQLCVVGGATVAVPSWPAPTYLPASDGVLCERARPNATLKTVLLSQQAPSSDRLLIAGCDPALSVLAAHARKAGVDVALASCNSTQALELLRDGRIHIAGTHLRGAAGGGSNLPAVRRVFAAGSVRVVTFASWQQGWVVAPRNPKNIRCGGDLAREDVRIVNRETGAGSRILLDLELRKAGVEARAVHGYDRLARGHLPAAWHVVNALADCCVAAEAAARAFGLDFMPIRAERFDFVIPKELAASRPVQALLNAMQTRSFRQDLEILAGYDTGQTGRDAT